MQQINKIKQEFIMRHIQNISNTKHTKSYLNKTLNESLLVSKSR